MSGSTSKRYPVELRWRAVRMVAELRPDYESDWAAMTRSRDAAGCRDAGDDPEDSGTSVITVRIESSVDLLVPDVLGGGRPSFALDATQAVPIGQYQEVARAAD